MTQFPQPGAPIQNIQAQNQQYQDWTQQQEMQQPFYPQPAAQQPTQLPAVIGEVPAYLVAASDAPQGIEKVRDYLLPSFLMIRQPMCDNAQARQMFQEGDVYLSPELRGIYTAATGRVPVDFTPIAQFTEYVIQNPRGKGLRWIREKSTDPKSDIAKRAMNPAWREAQCPEFPDKVCQYVECINFLVALRIKDAPTLPVIINFQRAEQITGRKFCNLLLQRTGPNGVLPIYSGVFQFTTGTRTNEKGTWYGLNIVNHPQTPYVTAEEFEIFKQMHIDLTHKIAKGEVQADYESADVGMPTGPQPVQQAQQVLTPQQQAQYYAPPNAGNGAAQAAAQAMIPDPF